MKNWKFLFLFEEIEFPNFLFEEIESPFFFWRNWKSLFYLKKLNPFILFEELKVHFFNWRNWIPFFIWRYWKSLFYLKKWNRRLLRIFDVKQTELLGKKVKIVLGMQAHFEEKSFFGRKDNKMPCIIDTIWGKINFLEFFGVKTNWKIRQKSQNSARYAGAF